MKPRRAGTGKAGECVKQWGFGEGMWWVEYILNGRLIRSVLVKEAVNGSRRAPAPCDAGQAGMSEASILGSFWI